MPIADISKWTDDLIEAAEEARCVAMIEGNSKALFALFATDATWIHSSGHVDDRAAFIAKIESGQSRYLTIDRRDVRHRLYGNVAITGGVVTMTASANGVFKDLRNRYTNMWVADGEGIILVSAQSTKID